MKKDPFIGSLPIVAKAIGRRYGVNVTIGGDDAYTDGKTINIPALPQDGDERLKTLVNGYLDHEASHCRFTDFSVQRAGGKRPFQHWLENALEDVRIETLMGQTYPGSKKHLSDLASETVNSGLEKPCPDDVKPPQAVSAHVLHGLRWKVLGQPAMQPLADKAAKKVAELLPASTVSQLDAMLDEVRSTESTQEVIDLSARIVKFLQEEQDDLEDQDQQDDSSSQQSSSNSDEDDEGQDEADGSESDSSEGDSEDGSEGEDGDNGDQSSGSSSKSDDGDEQSSDSSSQGSESDADEDESNESGNSGSDSSESSDDQSGSEESDSSSSTGGDQAGSAQDAAQAIADALGAGENQLPKDPGKALRDKLEQEASGQRTDRSDSVAISEVVESDNDGRAIPFDEKGVRQTSARIRSRLARLMQSQRMQRSVRKRSGSRLDRRSLPKVASGDPNVRPFKAKTPSEATDTAVTVLLDRSGSMAGKRLELAGETSLSLTWALAETPGISPAVFAFPGVDEGMLDDYSINSVHQRGARVDPKRFSLVEGGSTPLSSAAWAAGLDLMAAPQPRRVLLVITDGIPNEPIMARNTLERLRAAGVETLAVGIKYEIDDFLFPTNTSIFSIDELPTSLFGLLENALLNPAA